MTIRVTRLAWAGLGLVLAAAVLLEWRVRAVGGESLGASEPQVDLILKGLGAAALGIVMTPRCGKSTRVLFATICTVVSFSVAAGLYRQLPNGYVVATLATLLLAGVVTARSAGDGKGTTRASRRSVLMVGRCGEGIAYVSGVAALVVVIGHIALLLHLVTLGPLPLPFPGSSDGTAVLYAFEAVGLRELVLDGALLGGFVLVCSGLVVARRLRLLGGAHAGSMVMQIAVSLAVLAWSYRLPGLMAALCVIGWLWRRGNVGWTGWCAWAVSLAVCFFPYDVTCRNFEGAARLETNLHCHTGMSFDDYRASRKVCVGSGDNTLYNEPTGVWVW